MKLGLTAAIAAVLITSLAYYASAFGSSSSSSSGTQAQRRRRKRDSDDYYADVPPEILHNDNDEICECKEELILAVRIAQEGESLLFVMVIVGACSCS